MLGFDALRYSRNDGANNAIVSAMKFQKGIGCPYYSRRPRGRGRGQYRMSRTAYQARRLNLLRWERPRSYDETRLIEFEIALATHRGESYRLMAKRLGLRSHAHCWRVARRYRRGLIPLLPRNEQGLVTLRDSLISQSGTDHEQPEQQQEPTRPEAIAGHGCGCPCGGCEASRAIEAVMREAREDGKHMQ
jgi:hypothetical protein